VGVEEQDALLLIPILKICAVGNNIMIIVSMDKIYKMGWHICQSLCVPRSYLLCLWFIGDIEATLLYGTMKSAQVRQIQYIIPTAA
jgi:hypothetical protein